MSKASISLPERAVHPFFLLQVQSTVADYQGKKVPLGELLVSDVVQHYIKSATATANCDYVQALARKFVRNAWSREGKFREDMAASATTLNIERVCKDQPLYGPTTYFVSHCWSYKLKDLINLVMRHYDSQPGTAGGSTYQPLYYWLDIFAVQQNFKGDFKDHPDSDFPGVIRNAQAVLFTIMPWRAPLCVERVWCLFEALQAVSAHVELELLVEEIQSNQTVDKLQSVFVKVVVDNLDIRKCKSTVASDKKYILGQVEQSLGIERFNQIMQDSLRRKVMEVMLISAVQKNDLDSTTKMVKAGVRVTQRVLAFSGYTQFDTDDKGLKALAEVIKISTSVQAVTLHTTTTSKATHEGYATLAAALKNNNSVTDLSLCKGPREDLKKHEGGWVGPKAGAALGEMLALNTALKRLDLSRNIKLTGQGVANIAKGLSAANSSGLQELFLSEVSADNKGVAALADAIAAGATPVGGSKPTVNSLSGNSLGAAFGDKGPHGITASASFGGMPSSFMRSTGSTLGSGAFSSFAGVSSSSGSMLGRRGSVVMSAPKPRVPLQRLVLSNNSIGDGDACKSLGSMLSKAGTLTRLDLRGCDIGSAGAASLADGLAASSGITHLDLSSNKIGDEGAAALATALKKNRSLQVLELEGCEIKGPGGSSLGQSLSAGSAPLKELVLYGNSLGDTGAAAIGAGARGSTTLRRLDLGKCSITGKEGIAGVAAALHHNKVLRELDLRENSIKSAEGTDAAKSLADALQGNAVINKLYIGGVFSDQACAVLLKVQDSCKQLDIIR